MDTSGLNRWADSISSVVKRTELNLVRLKARSSTPAMPDRSFTSYRPRTSFLLADESCDQLQSQKDLSYERSSIAEPTQVNCFNSQREIADLRSQLERSLTEMKLQNHNDLIELRDRLNSFEVKLSTQDYRRNDMAEVRRLVEERSDVKFSILNAQLDDFARLSELKELEVMLKNTYTSRMDESRQSLELNKRQLGTLKQEILTEVFGNLEDIERSMVKKDTLTRAIEEVTDKLDDKLSLIERKIDLQLSRIRQEYQDEVSTSCSALQMGLAQELTNIKAALPRDKVTFEVIAALEKDLVNKLNRYHEQLTTKLDTVTGILQDNELVWRKELQRQIASIDLQGEIQDSARTFSGQVKSQADSFKRQLETMEQRFAEDLATIRADRPKPQEYDATCLLNEISELKKSLSEEVGQRGILENFLDTLVVRLDKVEQSHAIPARAVVDKEEAKASSHRVLPLQSLLNYKEDIAIEGNGKQTIAAKVESPVLSSSSIDDFEAVHEGLVERSVASTSVVPPSQSELKPKLHQFKFEIKGQPGRMEEQNESSSFHKKNKNRLEVLQPNLGSIISNDSKIIIEAKESFIPSPEPTEIESRAIPKRSPIHSVDPIYSEANASVSPKISKELQLSAKDLEEDNEDLSEFQKKLSHDDGIPNIEYDENQVVNDDQANYEEEEEELEAAVEDFIFMEVQNTLMLYFEFEEEGEGSYHEDDEFMDSEGVDLESENSDNMDLFAVKMLRGSNLLKGNGLPRGLPQGPVDLNESFVVSQENSSIEFDD